MKLYALLAPHLGATGYGNIAAVMSYHGRVILGAEQGPFGAALAAVDEGQRDAIGRASAGYVGTSDGWQDFARNGRMTWEYRRAGPGNVALMAELPRRAVLALGFGRAPKQRRLWQSAACCSPSTISCSSRPPCGSNGRPNAASVIPCRSMCRRPWPTSF